jgi:N-methylhydantoinase A
VTDANLVLGYLDAATFLGGRRELDRGAAEAAIDQLASRLSLPRDAAALGMYRLINLKMADGIRLMTLRRGVDPRKFVLLSFGGAAGLHAVEVARELEIPRVVVPAVASVLSAWGMLTSDLRYEVSRTHIGEEATLDDGALRAIFAALEAEASSRVRSWFDGPLRIERSAEMRYGEQIFEIDVPLDDVDWESSTLLDEVHERFHRRHEELYTYASRGQEVVLVNVRVAVVGEVGALSIEPDRRPTAAEATPRRTQRAYFGAWREVPVFAFDDLGPGARVAGPAIIEAETTTVVINVGDELERNELGWLDIRVGSAAGPGGRG